jgi:hypothetical protein
VSVTVTPGSTAPDVSVTLPKISPVGAWAHAVAANTASDSAATKAEIRNLMYRFLRNERNEMANAAEELAKWVPREM